MEGRSNDHGCHEIRCVYETESVERALDLEDALVKHFGVVPDAGGIEVAVPHRPERILGVAKEGNRR